MISVGDYIYRAVREPSQTVSSDILPIVEAFASTMKRPATIEPWRMQIAQEFPCELQDHQNRVGRRVEAIHIA